MGFIAILSYSRLFRDLLTMVTKGDLSTRYYMVIYINLSTKYFIFS